MWMFPLKIIFCVGYIVVSIIKDLSRTIMTLINDLFLFYINLTSLTLSMLFFMSWNPLVFRYINVDLHQVFPVVHIILLVSLLSEFRSAVWEFSYRMHFL